MYGAGAEKYGTFNEYNYTKDQKTVTAAGAFTRDIIRFTSYEDYDKTLDELLLSSIFNNGRELTCKIELYQK